MFRIFDHFLVVYEWLCDSSVFLALKRIKQWSCAGKKANARLGCYVHLRLYYFVVLERLPKVDSPSGFCSLSVI